MRFLAISSPTGNPDAGTDYDMDAEVANGRRLFEEGFIVQGYMDPSYTTAIFLIEAADEAAAQANLATYPEVQAGAATYQLTPLIGLPAISQSLAERGEPLPTWWPV